MESEGQLDDIHVNLSWKGGDEADKAADGRPVFFVKIGELIDALKMPEI
jgi:hypothetical protein